MDSRTGNLKVAADLLFGLVVMSLPGVGVVMADSLGWNIVWWSVFVALAVVLIYYGSSSNVGLMIVIASTLILLEANAGRPWGYVWGAIQAMCWPTIWMSHKRDLSD